MTNKTCARERGAKERSTSQTWCLRGEAHSHNKKNVCKGEESRREKHYTNPVIARRRTLNLQIKSVQKWQKPSKTAKSAWAKHKRTKDKIKNERTKTIEKTIQTSSRMDDKGERKAKGRTRAGENLSSETSKNCICKVAGLYWGCSSLAAETGGTWIRAWAAGTAASTGACTTVITQ